MSQSDAGSKAARETPKKQHAPKYVRPGPAAVRLGISLPTLWRWAATRADFPKPIRLGPRVTCWDVDELDAFVARQAVSA